MEAEPVSRSPGCGNRIDQGPDRETCVVSGICRSANQPIALRRRRSIATLTQPPDDKGSSVTVAAALREHDTLLCDPLLGHDAPASHDEVLARYRRLRAINQRHHHEILKLISRDALLHQARRLGLARGKTLILDDMDEMHYVYDLAIHTAFAGALAGNRPLCQIGPACGWV
jgi:hypothetical protein